MNAWPARGMAGHTTHPIHLEAELTLRLIVHRHCNFLAAYPRLAMEAVVKKFNNTLEGTDCGDAGLPTLSRGIAKAKTVLRVVPKTPDICVRVHFMTHPSATAEKGRATGATRRA